MATVPAPRTLTIATRESALAMWQAEHVRDRLRELYPACDVRLLGMTTQGDRILDQPLAAIGGKGLFIKELEVAMAEGRADLAVHALKDVPADAAGGLRAGGGLRARGRARRAGLEPLSRPRGSCPGGARVGTSCLRREAQLRERDPLLDILPLRGEVERPAAPARRGSLRRDRRRRRGR